MPERTIEKLALKIRQKAVDDVLAERVRQDAKFGEQNCDQFVWLSIIGEEFGEACQCALHDQFGGYAAGSLRREAIHLAAVALSFVEFLDRRDTSVIKYLESEDDDAG